MSDKKAKHLLKCREDREPLCLEVLPGAPGGTTFVLPEGSSCSWAKPGEELTPIKLRAHIEPWLTALCQTEHLSLLVGSGLTHAVSAVANTSAFARAEKRSDSLGAKPLSMDQVDLGEFSALIDPEVKRLAEAAERGAGNIEDQIRVGMELLRGYEILQKSEEAGALRKHLNGALETFARGVLGAERALIFAPSAERELALNYLVSFLMSFAARSGTRDRLHIFTTNYERLIEAGADLAGLHLLDRFVGALSPVFRSSRLDLDLHYNPPGIRGEPRYLEGVARFTKLHGSIDWIMQGRHIRRVGVPFGASDLRPYLQADPAHSSRDMPLMIYPNAGKDRETAAYPYVELFRDFAAATCRPNTTLLTYGYSFGDEHINRVIEDMLTIPSTHLVISAYGDPLDRIMRTYERVGRPSQISLLLGSHLGSLKALVDHYLPKPAVDRTSFRMAELLNARWSTTRRDLPSDSSSGSAETYSTGKEPR